MKMKILTIIFLVGFLFSCEVSSFLGLDEETSGVRYGEDYYYVISGNLYEDESINPENPIFIGKTIPYEDGSFFNVLIDPSSVDAKITYFNSHEDIEYVYPLIFYLSFEPYCIGYVDPNFANPDECFLPKKNRTYRIDVSITDTNGVVNNVWAETTIPSHISIKDDSVFAYSEPENDDEFPELAYETANHEHPLKIIATSRGEHNLYFNFFCLEEWEEDSTAIEYIINFGGQDKPDNEEEYDEDRENEFYYIYMPKSVNGERIIEEKAYNSYFTFYGKYRIDIYHVDDNYFHYLYKPEGYRFGGIHNGLGYFGSMSGIRMFTKVMR